MKRYEVIVGNVGSFETDSAREMRRLRYEYTRQSLLQEGRAALETVTVINNTLDYVQWEMCPKDVARELFALSVSEGQNTTDRETERICLEAGFITVRGRFQHITEQGVLFLEGFPELEDELEEEEPEEEPEEEED